MPLLCLKRKYNELFKTVNTCERAKNSPSEMYLYVYMYMLKGMAKKNFIVSFKRDSKTINRSLLQSFYICFTSGDILT